MRWSRSSALITYQRCESASSASVVLKSGFERYAVGSFLGLVFALLPHFSAAGQPCPSFLGNSEAMSRLMSGGLVILLRHAEDVMKATSRSCEEPGRVLSSNGRAQAAKIREAIQELSIPVAQVLYSPTCRTLQTAEKIFPQQKRQVEPRLRIKAAPEWMAQQLLSRPTNGNLFLVTHGTVFNRLRIDGRQVAFGYSSYGLAAVFEPGQGGGKLLGCLKPEDWKSLLGTR